MPSLYDKLTSTAGKTYKEWDDEDVASWTTDSSKGDNTAYTTKDGITFYPIWKNSLTGATSTAVNRYNKLTNPKSSYYTSIAKQIKQAVSGAYSPNTVLAQMVAAGGSASQARAQIQANQSKVTDTTNSLMNQYYLNASGQANSLLGTIGQLTGTQKEYDLAKEQSGTSFWENLLKTGVGIGSALLSGGTTTAASAGTTLMGSLSSYTDPTVGKKWTINGYQ